MAEVHRTERSPAVDAATGQSMLFNPQQKYRVF